MEKGRQIIIIRKTNQCLMVLANKLDMLIFWEGKKGVALS